MRTSESAENRLPAIDWKTGQLAPYPKELSSYVGLSPLSYQAADSLNETFPLRHFLRWRELNYQRLDDGILRVRLIGLASRNRTVRIWVVAMVLFLRHTQL